MTTPSTHRENMSKENENIDTGLDRAWKFLRKKAEQGDARRSPYLMADFAILEVERAVREEREKIADELEAMMNERRFGYGMKNYVAYIGRLRGKAK